MKNIFEKVCKIKKALYICIVKQLKQNKMTNVIAHTNARLENWYFNAKKDFGVIGSGLAKFNSNNEVEIRYEENGVKCLFKHYWHADFKIDTIFDIWQTEANPENDKIEN